MAQIMDQMNIVIVGHVDHGKSTLIGRLLADTGSLPEGKLESVRLMCARNAKPFEYAFLLDALKDEQSQGITIDSARCFFNTAKRRYIIIDAPGHIEFLKNMITGAARAEAALLLIDAHEGVQENSKRHGYMLHLLGIRQVVVVVNKMDLVNYDEAAFLKVKTEYEAFLGQFGLVPSAFIPIAARDGENMVTPSDKMLWYTGKSVLDHIDDFNQAKDKQELPFRMSVQDVYKFTAANDDRRIVSGTVMSGRLKVGDEVVFFPSQKRSRVKTIEGFNQAPRTAISAGEATGFTLETQIYIRPGDLVVKATDAPPLSGTTFKVSLFWLGRTPMTVGKAYKLKLASTRVTVYLKEIVSVMDASELQIEENRREIRRHEVAECVLETLKPLAFDLASNFEGTSRFVIVDAYEIAAGGIVVGHVAETATAVQKYREQRDASWEKGLMDVASRQKLLGQRARAVVLVGDRAPEMGKLLEQHLIENGRLAYFLGRASVMSGMGADYSGALSREEFVRRLGELAHVFTDAGLIFITSMQECDDSEVEILSVLSDPFEILIVTCGLNPFSKRIPDAQISDDTTAEDAKVLLTQLLADRDVVPEYFL
jgi:bifunctional enzyme CysN/CysC